MLRLEIAQQLNRFSFQSFSGINYDKPLPPIQVASQRAERIAKEKKVTVLPLDALVTLSITGLVLSTNKAFIGCLLILLCLYRTASAVIRALYVFIGCLLNIMSL